MASYTVEFEFSYTGQEELQNRLISLINNIKFWTGKNPSKIKVTEDEYRQIERIVDEWGRGHAIETKWAVPKPHLTCIKILGVTIEKE